MDIIAVDGPDGTGKSTLSRLLAQDQGAARLHFPSERKTFQTDEESVLWYLSDFEQGLQDLSPETDRLVMDRSFVSTMAYQGFAENGYARKEWALLSSMRIGMRQLVHRADRLVFVGLSCKTDTMIRRLQSEPSEEADLISEMDSSDQKARLEGLQRCYTRAYGLLERRFPDHTYLTLNSEEKPPEELVTAFYSRSS